ncbi:hypothetical protein C0J52_26532 [Blattella germanica]|nr:hypothetical protein C0J52_26532 [Blattella germanica]
MHPLRRSYTPEEVNNHCERYVWGQTYVENAQTRIPESLIECYRNQTLRHPENRPPMHIQTFIDLVRKVEKYQQNTEGVGILATSMLHRFRQDGIERSPDVVETEGVVPYAVKGNAFFKHRLILKYLISSNGYKFPNESLSQVELCTLHFMLSHSIERTLRGDESTVCSKVSNYESYRGSRIPRDTRFRRQVEAEEAALSKEYSESEKQLLNNIRDEESEENVNVTTPDLQGTSEELSVTNDSLEENPTLESKEVDQNDDSNSTHMADAVDFINGTSVNNQSKSGKFVFDDGFDIETNNQPAPRKLIGYTSSTRLTSPSYIDSSRPKPRVSVTSEESDCPVELGVVRTEWGSVSLGTVLAGIAAGLYSQQIQVQKLVAGGPRAHTLSAALSTSLVDNKFAATLTVSLEQGPKATIKVGTNGGWNSTIYPRWYFDKERSDNQMTDAEIRGGLDERYRACQRKDLYSEVAPVETMREQQLHVGEYGSTVTIIDGKTGAPFLKNAEYSIDIDTNFTESSYRTHESGMDIPKALEQHLKTSMQHLLNEERSKNMGGGRSTIVLFIPSETVNLNQNDLSIAQNQIKNFKDYLPVPIRLTNPNCGSDWNGNAYNRADFTYSVKQYGTNYHKLHANYFFSVGSAEIKVCVPFS